MSTEPQHSILLVEDDLRLAELVSRYLANHGFNMTIVSRGDEVVERVQAGNPDLVILDLGLPGEDGFSICKRLRPDFANPILILTARDNDIDHVLGLARKPLELVLFQVMTFSAFHPFIVLPGEAFRSRLTTPRRGRNGVRS